MATVSLCPTAGVLYQAFTTGGLPLNAGLLYQYAAGGTTPTATYTTSAGSVQNANPIVLGADGRPPNEIWLVNGTAYRFDLYDSLSNLIASYDNISGIAASISGTYLATSGGTMTGNIAMGTNKITGLGAATANGDAVRYEQSPAAILTAKGALIGASAANTPAVVTVGTNGQGLVANSNNTNGVNWAFPAIRSYLSGCTLSTAGNSATMSIAAGLAVDTTSVSAMVLAAIAKTTSAWAVGTGNGGKLSAAAIANSTWYHFYVIQRVDTGVVDVGFDVSATAPTMPTNYTLFRRIGSGKTDGSAKWTLFLQDGDEFKWDVPILDISDTNPGTSAITKTLTVPTGVRVKAMFNAAVFSLTTGQNAWLISDLSETDKAPSLTVAPLGTIYTNDNAASAGGSGSQGSCWTNTSAQVRVRLGAASGANDSTYLATYGWSDRRGRDS